MSWTMRWKITLQSRKAGPAAQAKRKAAAHVQPHERKGTEADLAASPRSHLRRRMTRTRRTQKDERAKQRKQRTLKGRRKRKQQKQPHRTQRNQHSRSRPPNHHHRRKHRPNSPTEGTSEPSIWWNRCSELGSMSIGAAD